LFCHKLATVRQAYSEHNSYYFITKTGVSWSVQPQGGGGGLSIVGKGNCVRFHCQYNVPNL